MHASERFSDFKVILAKKLSFEIQFKKSAFVFISVEAREKRLVRYTKVGMLMLQHAGMIKVGKE